MALLEKLNNFLGVIRSRFDEKDISLSIEHGELVGIVNRDSLLLVCNFLKKNEKTSVEQLIDLCVVDYLTYGMDSWTTGSATSSGFNRARRTVGLEDKKLSLRYAVCYNLLSVSKGVRLRLKLYLDDVDLLVTTVTTIWKSADWFEREAFDLFGVNFIGHPDLRRLLTDYGFKHYPLRKNFPLSGFVEMRYDKNRGHVVYQPVTIKDRVTVPRVIR